MVLLTSLLKKYIFYAYDQFSRGVANVCLAPPADAYFFCLILNADELNLGNDLKYKPKHV